MRNPKRTLISMLVVVVASITYLACGPEIRVPSQDDSGVQDANVPDAPNSGL